MALPEKSTSADYIEEIAFGPPATATTSYNAPTPESTAAPGSASALATQTPTETQAVTTGATPAATAAPGAPIAPIAPTTQAGENYSISLGNYAPDPAISGLYGSLFAPIAGQVETAGQGLQAATTGFTGEVGARDTWDTLGGEAILGDVLAGTRPDEEAVNLGKTQYQGPQKISQEAIDPLIGDLSGLTGWTDAMDGGGYIEELLSEQAPGLTSGERRFETGIARKDPGFQAAQAATVKSIEQLNADLNRVQSEALGIAEQRAADTEAIRNQTQGYLTGKSGEYQGLWDKAVAEKQAENDRIKALVDAFEANPTIENLEQIPRWARPDWRAKDFDTGVRQQYDQGQEAWKAIWGDPKYAEIAEIPLMVPTITSHGRETLGFPDEWWKENSSKYGKKHLAKIKELVRARQKELSAAGFMGDETRNKRATSAVVEHKDMGIEPGKYSEVMPMYHADEWFTPEDLSAYIAMEAMDPNRENISTAGERAGYNKIADLLQQITGNTQDVIADDATPWARAQVLGDDEAYRANEKESYGKYRDELKSNQADWLNTRHKARHDYRKAKGGGLTGFLKNVATGRLGKAANNLANFDEMDWLVGFMGPDAFSQNELRKRAGKKAEKETEKAYGKTKAKTPNTKR